MAKRTEKPHRARRLALVLAALVFAAPQTCADALQQGLALCGGPLLVSLFPFLVVSALIMRSGAGEVLGVLLWPVVRCIGLRSTLRWPLHRTASDTGPFSRTHRFSLLGKIRLTGLPLSNRVEPPS